jgi:prepilin-type N-terminal cleavage/methylation domain-containing protein
MKNQSLPSSRQGFTLVELLVVIAIIIILAAAGFGVGSKAIQSARKTVAKNSCINLVVAVDAFYDEYQRLPGVSGGEDWETETDSAFMDILLGFETADPIENEKGVRFFTGPDAKGSKRTTATGGLFYTDRHAELFDPFRRDTGNRKNGHYFVLLDGDFDEELQDPTSNGRTLYGKRALAWSVGKDDRLGTGKDEYTKDNVYSWK